MKKNLLFIMLIALFSSYTLAQSPSITESGGWLETAYVKWQPVSSAESYNVYYSGNGTTNKQIDDQLIRDYGSYFRADIPGLAAGSYTIKVVPVINASESSSSTTSSITVKAHDRSGFAFSNGIVPGAYKTNGTPKDGAVILYITENTKNTISLNVTGATTNPCVGLQNILYGFKKGDDNRPLIIRLVGEITDMSVMDKGDIVIENGNNSSGYITLEGIGDDATANGWGIRVKNANNIEIRNIGTMNCDSEEGDNIGLQQGNYYVWVHNCDFFYGNPGGDADQAKGDGALDSKKSSYVTHAYNHFFDSGKSNLLGNGGETPGYFTYHHNWYDHSDSRHPRVREHTVHVYNNYFDGIAKYGIGATTACSIFSENNYFRNCKYPMLISEQGSDVYGSNDGTFSGNPGGMIKAYGNYIEGATRFVDQNDYATDFDAYVVSSKSEQISSSVVTVSGSNIYNNFDTSSDMYSYSVESASNAKATVLAYAGRMNGGDFTWTFNNSADDTSYDVNTALKSALTSYSTSLVGVQNEDYVDDPDDPTDPTDPIIGDIAHNFTTSGSSSSDFTISGNLSTSKGTVTYGELTLTQCLKMESSTSISFSTAEEAILVLVLNETFSGSIYVDGTSYTASSGIVTVTIASGDHTITKGDSANLYYISLTFTNQDNAAVLTKQGVGSSTQTIDLGEAITQFNYEWANATTVTASGFPNGIITTIDNTAQTITISGTPTETGTFTFTVSTIGATENATTYGTITVNEIDLPATLVKQGVGSSTQTIELGNSITEFNYAWTNATTATASGLPSGVSATVNNTAQTITINGTPTETGTFSFTVSTTGATQNATTYGTITVNEIDLPATLVKQGVGSSTQTIVLGNSITEFNYAWTNATTASAAGLPSGISATVDNTAQTITINGTPTETGTFAFTVSTQGGSSNVSLSGTITINNSSESSIIQENEIGFCSVDGTIDSNNAGFSGEGFANTTNALGAGINWYLLADGGSYTLTWMYANGGSTDRTANLIINDETVASVSFGSTGNWTSWSTTSATVTLDYNVYDIRLEATTTSGLANIDYIELSGDAFSIVECGTVIDDEIITSQEYIHNFTESGTSSDFFSISGNLSSTKGTVYYNELTLTQCLKIESSTSIAFTTTDAGTLTLVLNSDFTDGIKIDGTTVYATAGIVSESISAGSHQITKSNTANLYYISVAIPSTKSATFDVEDDQAEADGLRLAPNPVQGQLIISTNDEVKSVQIYNLSGSLVINQQGYDTSVDVSSLDAGSYIVVVSTSDSITKQIIIKQ